MNYVPLMAVVLCDKRGVHSLVRGLAMRLTQTERNVLEWVAASPMQQGLWEQNCRCQSELNLETFPPPRFLQKTLF